MTRFSKLLVCLAASMVLAAHFLTADPLVTTGRVAGNSKIPENNNEGKMYDVKVYGATGDRVTGDTAAFASVVAAATKVHGIIQIPAGTYVARFYHAGK